MAGKTKGNCARTMPWGKSVPSKTQILNRHSSSNRYPKRSCSSKGLSCSTIIGKRQTRSCAAIKNYIETNISTTDIINNHGGASAGFGLSDDRFICDAKSYELSSHEFRNSFDDLDGNRKTSGCKCLSKNSPTCQSAAATTRTESEDSSLASSKTHKHQCSSPARSDDSCCSIDSFIESSVSSIVSDDSDRHCVYDNNICNSSTIETSNNNGEFVGANINVSTSAAPTIDFDINDDSFDSFFFDSILHQIFLDNIEKENVEPPMHNSQQNAYYLNDIEHNDYCFNTNQLINNLFCTDDLPLSPSPSLDHCYAKSNVDTSDVPDLWSMPNSMFLPLLPVHTQLPASSPPPQPPMHTSLPMSPPLSPSQAMQQMPEDIEEAEFERFVHSAFSVFDRE